MKTRVLKRGGCYIPQGRYLLPPFWRDICDPQFERESEELDDYTSELMPDEIAESCAMRFARSNHDYLGTVVYVPLRARLLKFLQGPPGPIGQQGAPGEQGCRGDSGYARGALDLQCPNTACGKFLQDRPVQDLKIDLIDGHEFTHICNSCQHGCVWRIVKGLPIPVPVLGK